jgi:hypothetical protein
MYDNLEYKQWQNMMFKIEGDSGLEQLKVS